MKTLADFKRSMTVGSIWNTTHEYIGENPRPAKELGHRTCAIADTVKFGFLLDNGRTSYCDWPKASECNFSGNVVTITKEGFVRLTYTLVS